MTTNQETSLRERLLAEAAEFERAAGNNTDPDEGGHDKATARLLREAAEALAARAEPQAGEWVLVPRKLTAENGAKAALIGEFAFRDGSGSEHNVPWHVIKEIHSRVVETFAAAPSPASRARPEAQGEWDAAMRDASLYGTGYLVGGKRVPPERVQITTPPADRAPGEVGEGDERAPDCLECGAARNESHALGCSSNAAAELTLAARAPSAQGEAHVTVKDGDWTGTYDEWQRRGTSAPAAGDGENNHA